MRIEDYAGMDMFAWKAKSRDIIPDWPRGRSTIPALRLSLAYCLVDELLSLSINPKQLEVLWGGNGDIVDEPRLREDIETELAEYWRNADMMAEYYATAATWRETGKPDHCPECFNDGRRRKRLAVYQQQGYWIIRCFQCFSLWQQNPLPFPDNIVHLVKRGSEVVWPEVTRL